MARKRGEPRRVEFATEHTELVEIVHQAIRERGPLNARELATAEQARAGLTTGAFRSDKAVNQALYYLWIAGELMTHGRRGLEYVYDLRERIWPPSFDRIATAEESDAFFALKTLQTGGMLSALEWKQWFAGTIKRPVSAGETRDHLDTLVKGGKIVSVMVQEEPKTPQFLLAEDFPLLEQLHTGALPAAWQPLTAGACKCFNSMSQFLDNYLTYITFGLSRVKVFGAASKVLSIVGWKKRECWHDVR